MIKLNGKVVDFKKFPNNETLLDIDLSEMLVANLAFKYEEDGDLIKLMLLKDYLDQRGILALKLTIYFMPYSQMDRSENGSPFTLKTIAKFINSMNFDGVTIIEPHSDVTMALVDHAIPRYITIDMLGRVMKEMKFNKETDYLFFPDAGAQKRYKDLKGFKHLVGYKSRNFETGKIDAFQVVGTPPENPGKILIMDDMTSKGGTFLGAGNELKKIGFQEINLLVAHCQNAVYDGDLLKGDSPIHKIFTTDTVITKQYEWSNLKYAEKLKIYDIEEVLK
ncbi:ribose-phosphate pyrophosphokinase [Priestia aryabhattai]|uniref:ribose-phosphate pyrophosphokinase n=1 Tax=Priestia aryabhattai TaxID=412384 RepID=UPI00399FD6D4